MNSQDHDAVAQDEQSQPPLSAGEDRNGAPQDGLAAEPDTDDLTYNSVQPRRTTTVLVCYRIRGRGQPLPYFLDEEDAG